MSGFGTGVYVDASGRPAFGIHHGAPPGAGGFGGNPFQVPVPAPTLMSTDTGSRLDDMALEISEIKATLREMHAVAYKIHTTMGKIAEALTRLQAPISGVD